MTISHDMDAALAKAGVRLPLTGGGWRFRLGFKSLHAFSADNDGIPVFDAKGLPLNLVYRGVPVDATDAISGFELVKVGG